MSTDDQFGDNLRRYIERERRLRVWTWLSLLVPICLFVVLLVMISKASITLTKLNTDIDSKKEELAAKKKELAALQQTQAESNFALNAVIRANRPTGTVPRIVYYRDSETQILRGALEQLGIKPEAIQANYASSNPTLAGKPVDTLAYGCAVTEQDLRLIAAALMKAGMPIRRLTPAVSQKDPLLVQLIASAKTDSTKPPPDPATLKKTIPDCPAPKQ